MLRDRDLTRLPQSCIMRPMEPPVKELKADLRTQCLARRRGLAPNQVAAGSRAILQRLLALDEYCRAQMVHTYVSSKDNEVDTRDFIRLSLEKCKRMAVPVVEPGTRVLQHAEIQDPGQLRPGRWGLLQPGADHQHWIGDLDTIDLVVVPGLAFDARGHRLGLGGGYYDRFLARVQAPKVGLSYDCLLLREVPVERGDVAVDIVVTESSTLYRGEES